MNDKQKHNEQEEVSRRLKDLPRVKASPDFETRLQRKITSLEKEHKRKSLFDVLFFPRRVPVFATSVLALVAVSVISYYVFVKSRDESSVNIPPPPTITKRSEPQQSGQASGGAVEDKFRQEEVAKQIQTQDDDKVVSMKKTVSPTMKLEKKNEVVSQEELPRPSEPMIESEEHAAASVQNNVEQGNAVQSKDEAREIQQNVQMKAAEPVQETQQKMVQPLQQFQIRSGSEKIPFTEFSAAPPTMKSGRIPDSVRIADSLRQDSIKKALQKRLLQQKQKIRPE